MLKTIALAMATVLGATVLGTVANPGQARALELGLTPSQVFGLWVNINNSLLAIGKLSSDDERWFSELSATTPKPFQDKNPRDVLALVKIFQSRFHASYSPHGGGVPESRTGAPSGNGGERSVTPSDVFLESGHVLDDLVERILELSERRLPITRFYARNSFRDKAPSHVYGLVDLAHRRLESVLAKSRS